MSAHEGDRKSWQAATRRADHVLTAVALILTAMSGVAAGTAIAHTDSNRTSSVAAPSTQQMHRHATLTSLPPSLPTFAGTSADILAQHRCLAEAMYYEARGEGENGELAVAEVVLNRLKSGMFGSSICAVVYQGAPRAGCQFSFACDGSRRGHKEFASWRRAQSLAARILVHEVAIQGITRDALNYHATYVRPWWAAQLVRTAQVGKHIFYRPQNSRSL